MTQINSVYEEFESVVLEQIGTQFKFRNSNECMENRVANGSAKRENLIAKNLYESVAILR